MCNVYVLCAVFCMTVSVFISIWDIGPDIIVSHVPGDSILRNDMAKDIHLVYSFGRFMAIVSDKGVTQRNLYSSLNPILGICDIFMPHFAIFNGKLMQYVAKEYSTKE